jgi:hypothetical protein
MNYQYTAALALLTSTLLFYHSDPASAVEVKYWGEVDLTSYECTDTESSFVHRICFEVNESHVVVLLRDTYYAYCNVDKGTVDDWVKADSKGRFYNQKVKDSSVNGRFSCR